MPIIQNKKISFFFTLLLFCGGFAIGQTYNFTEISLEKGLSQSQVNCIIEDSRGYLWIGTGGGGLNQYDGNTFKVYEEKDGLGGSIVNCIEEDHQGNIWVGTTWGGLSIFDGKNFKILTKEDGLFANGGVISICRGKNNQMLVAFDYGINIISGKVITPLHSEIFANHKIYKLFKDNQGNVWIITDKSLFLYNGYSLVNISQAFNIKFPFSSIAQDKNGNIWLGTFKNGLFILSKSGEKDYILTPYTKNEALNQFSIQSLLIDKENNLWLGTSDFGIVKYDYKTLTYINQANGFPNNNILSFCEDHYGNIWFGTSGSGIIKYFPCPFAYFDNIEGFKSADVFAILCDTKGGVWASSTGLGIYRLQNSQLEILDEKNGMLSRSARCLAEDGQGRIWFGTKNGINYLENGKIKVLEIPTKKKMIRTMLFDKSGNLWASIYGEGLLRYDGKDFTLFTEKDGLNFNYVHSLLQDKKGDIWIGTGNGINRFRNNKIENFTLGTEICNKYIGSITVDIYGNVWFGTDRCLIRYNGQEFKSFSVSDNLTSNTIYLLISDKKGNIYVGTNKGVDKIKIKANGDIESIKNFGIPEGFKGLECNSRSVAIDSSENIYFGTIKGVIKYLPENDKNEIHNTSIHITNIKLFPYDKTDWKQYSEKLSTWFNLPEDLELPYHDRNISFDFIGINLFNPEKVKYEIYLKGYDKDWFKTTGKTATYTNLPAGTYTFNVKAYINDEKNASIAKFSFKVNPPFWATWWFVLLTIGIIGLGFYLFLKYRTKRIRQSNDKLENLIEIRTREISKQKHEIETLYKEVHHRVKNNLQVINSIINLQSSYIDDEKTLAVFKECQNRVYTMAVLHEKLYSSKDITNNRIEPYVKEIVEYLAYVYKNDFDIDIRIKIEVNNIGLDTTIPIGLLINEIVSNSFKYAFDKTIENKCIHIIIEQTGEREYRMLIGDNGKGFKETANKEYVSFGLELTNILVDQLNGKITKLNKPGTNYEIIFYNIDKDLNKTP